MLQWSSSAPCTTTFRDTTTPVDRSPPHPPLPSLREPAALTPSPPPRCIPDRTRLGEDTYGRHRGARYYFCEAEGGPRSTSRTAWSTTHSPRMVTRTTTPFPSAKGGTGLCRYRPPPSTGTGSLLLEKLAKSGPAHREHGEGPHLQPELLALPALPPMFQDTLTEDRLQRILANVRNCLGLPLGTGVVQEWVLSNAALKAYLAHEESTRAHMGAFATTEAAQAKATTSQTAAEQRTRAAAEESPASRGNGRWGVAVGQLRWRRLSERHGRQMLPSCEPKGLSQSPATTTAGVVVFPPLQLRWCPILQAFLPFLSREPRTRTRGLTPPLLPRKPHLRLLGPTLPQNQRRVPLPPLGRGFYLLRELLPQTFETTRMRQPSTSWVLRPPKLCEPLLRHLGPVPPR